MDGLERGRRVLQAYGDAWERRDADAAAALFTEGATYRHDPFVPPLEGREAIRRYWAQGPGARQRAVRFRAGPVREAGGTLYAEWEAEFTRGPSGRQVALRGILILELEGDLISDLREYWHRRETPPRSREAPAT